MSEPVNCNPASSPPILSTQSSPFPQPWTVVMDPHSSATTDPLEAMALAAAAAADDRKGDQITILRVTEVSYLADYFVIVTGFSPVQVKAIARAIADRLAQQWQRHPLRTEGQGEGRWILQDYGDLVIHIFMPQEREFYNLEAFWGHGQRIPFHPSLPPFPGINPMV